MPLLTEIGVWRLMTSRSIRRNIFSSRTSAKGTGTETDTNVSIPAGASNVALPCQSSNIQTLVYTDVPISLIVTTATGSLTFLIQDVFLLSSPITGLAVSNAESTAANVTLIQA